LGKHCHHWQATTPSSGFFGSCGNQ
jgi:hypothetical protein